MNVIIAGIIDTRTGTITDTLTKQKGKTANRLKVRDELNKEHGKDTFMTFEFSTLSNVSYIKRNMASNDPALTHELDVLQCRFNIAETDKSILRQQDEINIAEEAVEECAAIFSVSPLALFISSSAKCQFIADAAENEIKELESELSSSKVSRRFLIDKLNKLEAKPNV